jgi:hypothetical protein
MNSKVAERLASIVIAGALLSVGPSGCVDDDGKTPGNKSGQEQDEDSGHEHEGDAGHEHAEDGSMPDAGEEPADPVYALVTQVFTADNPVSYLIRHDGELNEGSISLDDGDEFGGRALAAGNPYGGSVYVGGNESAELVRFDLDAAGELVKYKDTLNFAGRGADAIGEYAGQLVVVSDEKAYYFDARTLNAIIWNPKTMRATGAIDLSELARAGSSVNFSTLAVRVDARLYMPVGYRSLDNLTVPSAAAVVIIDTDADSAELTTDDRCGYVRDAALGEDGKIYVATEAFGSAVHRVSADAAPAPCLLRIDPATDAFEDGFHVALNELAAGSTVGSLIKVPNGKTYVRVLDDEAFEVQANTMPRVLASAPAWAWKEIALGDAPSLSDVPNSPLSGGSMIPLPAGDRLYVPEFAADRSSTTLRDISDGPSDVTTTVPGLVFSLVRLQ